MAKQTDNFINYTLQWLLFRTHWVLSALYLVVTLVFKWTRFELIWLVFWFLLGFVITLLVKGWKKKQQELDQSFDLEKCEEVSLDSNEHIWTKFVGKVRTIFVQLVDMPLWIKIHWLIVFGFLGMTFWYMLRGLDLLFIGPNDFAIIAFAILVILSLLWLVIMISSNKKNVLGYIVFYIVFDLLTAFQFNYIHFYDNVSQTQSMERDMNACELYINHQRPIISRITQSVESDLASSKAIAEKLILEIKENNDHGDSKYQEIDYSQDDEVIKQKRLQAKNLYKIANNKQEKYNRENGRLIKLEAFRNQLTPILKLEDSINHLCIEYQENKESFSQIDLKHARKALFDLDENISLLKDTMEAWYHIDLDSNNDSVNWAVYRLKKNRGDRFEGINKLIALFTRIVNPNFDRDSSLTNSLESIQYGSSPNSATAELLAKEEQDFENRLLIQSISLSVVIDLLPLALGIFVAAVKKRKEEC